ncbi:hypothetical protein [Tychonema sp. LEGE 07203]|uniref:hypothetical protein n=1 Tax=Tychonema sp. LEGE 07203 TaxID=1828671 RepID=UPI0019E8B846|nr:hypothetical protein [Tychonema sp. LEGE 07203]MBE9092957.1 hypothetical protein [Tychonema sp. LEGE 07203]
MAPDPVPSIDEKDFCKRSILSYHIVSGCIGIIKSSQQSTVNSQQSTVNSQQSTVNNSGMSATAIDITA